MNRSVVSRLVLAGVLASVGAVGVSHVATEARAANAASKSPAKGAVLMEDALETFFFELDRKSTSLAGSDEPPFAAPAFPGRDELRARFAARQPRVDVLRSKALAGETNRGFLEPRGAPSNLDQSTISEENTDRLALYEHIATQCNAKIDAVGRARAEKIGPIARRNVWVQDRSGEWAQKK